MAAKRKTRGSGQKDKYYFTQETQEAIVRWQAEENINKKNKIYISEIHPAFDKLVENLINIYKFMSYDSYEELKNDCINFLFEAISKFDNSRGTNAFSYFNVVAKRFLIVKSKQRATKSKNTISLDDSEELTEEDQNMINEHNMVQSHENELASLSLKSLRLDILYEVRHKIQNENEMKCINAVITSYEHAQDIDILTKTAIMNYMREITQLSNKQMTLAMQNIKKSYRSIRKELLKGDDEKI